jgi:hypothetical protein
MPDLVNTMSTPFMLIRSVPTNVTMTAGSDMVVFVEQCGS